MTLFLVQISLGFLRAVIIIEISYSEFTLGTVSTVWNGRCSSKLTCIHLIKEQPSLRVDFGSTCKDFVTTLITRSTIRSIHLNLLNNG